MALHQHRPVPLRSLPSVPSPRLRLQLRLSPSSPPPRSHAILALSAKPSPQPTCFRPSLSLRCPLRPCITAAAATPFPRFSVEDQGAYLRWDSLTATFAGAANLPFLLLQLPQIVLNAQNLHAGNNSALFAVPWLGMLTGLLGNISLLSYFAKKKETGAVLVQTLGVISNYIVLMQLVLAGAMPLPQFTATSAVVGAGLVLNFLNYFEWLPSVVWLLWEDFITVGGLAVLPQVMWSTFVPFVPSSILPGLVSGTLAIIAVVMARMGKLSMGTVKFIGSISGWTATLLFMWMPVAQMWTSYLNPENIKGLSSFTMLLAMVGNGLMIPRALFIRDLMWFTGSAWASFLYGWGNLACMYCFKSISKEFFLATTAAFLLWLGASFWGDSIAHKCSPVTSLKELCS